MAVNRNDARTKVGQVDPVWMRLRLDAEEMMRREPEMSQLVLSNILHQPSLEMAVAQRVSSLLGHPDMSSDLIKQAFEEVFATEAYLSGWLRADIMAVVDRDPACQRVIEPVLYFKGFHALQTHRLAHWLLGRGRRDFALYLQSRSSKVFQVDVNPAARIGKGVFFDHATGIVVGETAVIEDDVSILQGVTLGGTGKETGDRHPKIRQGVLIGAGATVLGNIEIGHCSKIAAGSMVLTAVPHNKTVAGVPARIVGETGCAEPSRAMDQLLGTLDAG